MKKLLFALMFMVGCGGETVAPIVEPPSPPRIQLEVYPSMPSLLEGLGYPSDAAAQYGYRAVVKFYAAGTERPDLIRNICIETKGSFEPMPVHRGLDFDVEIWFAHLGDPNTRDLQRTPFCPNPALTQPTKLCDSRHRPVRPDTLRWKVKLVGRNIERWGCDETS